MHGRLVALDHEYRAASERLHALAAASTEETWRRRPGAHRWSPSECVAHLVLTSNAFAPLLHQGLDEATRLGGAPPESYHRDVAGWVVGLFSGPTRWLRLKTTAAFVPNADLPMDTLLSEFDRVQVGHRACVRAADGLPIHRVKIRSPFDARLSYSLYSALEMIPGHQHRHLRQAEEALTRG